MSRFDLELRDAVWPRPRRQLEQRGVTAKTLRGPTWRTTSYGYFRPPAPDTTTQRILDAAALVPPGGAIGGWAAAYAHGVDWLDGGVGTTRSSLVPVILGCEVDRMPEDPRYFRGLLTDDEIVDRDGLSLTSLERTAFDCARWAPDLGSAVACLDATRRYAGLTVPALADWLPRVRGWRGVRQVRRALSLSNPRIRSVSESHLRVLYVTTVAPTLLVNCPIADRETRQIVAEVDLLDAEAGLAIEFDGAQHRELRQHHADNVREELLEDLNLVVTRVDRLDLGHAVQLTARLRSARRRGRSRDHRRDRWEAVAVPDEW